MPDGLVLHEWVIYDEWRTEMVPAYEKTTQPCSRCQALNGAVYRRGTGPTCPLHRHCRCGYRFHHAELVEVGR